MDDDTSGCGHAVHHGSDLYRETDKDAADKGEIGVSETQHHHHVEIGVSPQSHQHKSVPSSSTQPEETSKSSLDSDEMKNYINKCFAEKMAELVTLISKIHAEIFVVIQEDKIDEQQQSQEDGSNKQERQHKSDMQHEDYDKGSLNDIEVSRDEESNKKHLLKDKQLLDVNVVDKDAGREDNFKNEDCSDLQALEDEIMAYEEEYSDEELGKKNISDVEDLSDVNLTAKQDVTEMNLKNQKSTDVTDVQDEVGGTITDSIQSAVDTLLFGRSIPSTTKSLDVGASNKMTERHWDLPNSQIPPDFPDAQVRELQASKSKSPAKRERKKSRVLRSPYISKYGSGSKDAVDIDKEEKLKYAFDGYNINQDLPNKLMIDYSQWIVHLDVIFYHLRKKLKIHLGDNYRYTTTRCFFKKYVEKTHTRYYPAELAVDLSTQQDYAESIFVAKNEDAIANIIQGFCMPTGLPWYMVDEVYVSINCGKEFHWILAVIVLKERLISVYDSLSSKRKQEPPIEIQKLTVMLPTYLLDNGFYDKTERTDWPSLEAYKGKITQQTGLVNKIPFDVNYVQNIPQQAFDSLDCGVFVCAYAEILSEGLEVHSCEFDSACQRARYAFLLWHYGVKKENKGYTSDNGDPPRPRKSVIEEIEANAIVTLE
ncbi:uncharacterized protein LOC107865470 [Capsicum annuum]|uniref:uncharacterized protein LOC107865470 n=1 Tax=Capsicum annuum TaxID=4072 RepID=UPI001FB1558C|nr:uncharacterized protein LOC107865470 [Capsicum annuum]